MADVQEHMQRILKEHKDKNPELSYRFIDGTPEVLRVRTESDGFKIIKRADTPVGQTGEIRVGDLVLAAKPRKEIEEQQAREHKKTGGLLRSIEDQYHSRILRDGAGGRYLAPIGGPQSDNRQFYDKGGK